MLLPLLLNNLLSEGGAPTPTPTPAPAATGGGYAFENWLTIENQRRRRRKKELEEAREAVEAIEETTSREIGLLLQKQERKDSERETLERLRAMLPRIDAKALSERANEALDRARVRGTLSALSKLDRELKRMQEDEELAVLMLLLND